MIQRLNIKGTQSHLLCLQSNLSSFSCNITYSSSNLFCFYFFFSAFFSNLSKALSKILFLFHECAPCTSLNYTAKSSTARTNLLKFLTAFELFKVYPKKKPSSSVAFHCLIFLFAIWLCFISCNSLEIFTVSPAVTVYHSNLMNFVASK